MPAWATTSNTVTITSTDTPWAMNPRGYRPPFSLTPFTMPSALSTSSNFTIEPYPAQSVSLRADGSLLILSGAGVRVVIPPELLKDVVALAKMSLLGELAGAGDDRG